VAAFRSAVQLGEWEEAETLLFGTEHADQEGGVSLGNGNTTGSTASLRKDRLSYGSRNGSTQLGLPLSEGADTTWLKFLLRQQKYLELLEQRDLGAALGVLRNELTPLKKDVERLHFLSALMMIPSSDELRAEAAWDGAQGDSRSELLSEISKSISPSVMIPEHRLATLLTSIQQQQILNCQYHNTTVTPSLYTDHECASEDFPLQTLTELRNQTDEVWYLDFSHDGSMLATAGRDGLVNVYDTKRWMIVHEFREHERNALEARGVCYVAFSPDDRYLISCSQNNEFVVMDVRDGHMVCKADHFDYPVTAAAWLPDSLSFVIGTQSSRRPLGLYTLSSSNGSRPSPTSLILNYEVHSWREPHWENGSRENGNSFRVTDVAVSRDGTRMAVATTDNRIMTYDLNSKKKVDEWPMEDKITSINYSADGTLLLVNMNDSEINMGKLWSLDSTTGEEVMRYEGAQQAEFVIRSCFGGAGENFVMSGSEGKFIVLQDISFLNDES
jgi:WD40 repeat protein